MEETAFPSPFRILGSPFFIFLRVRLKKDNEELGTGNVE
jgi:hypothetical protein